MLGKIMSGMFDIGTKFKKSFTPKEFMRDLTDIQVTPSPEEIAEYRKTHRDELIAQAKRDFGIK